MFLFINLLSSIILTLVSPDYFWKIDLKAFFFFRTQNTQNYSGLFCLEISENGTKQDQKYGW